MNRFFTLSLPLAGATPTRHAAPRDDPDTPRPAGLSRIVYFDFDRATVRPIDRPLIQAHRSALNSATH